MEAFFLNVERDINQFLLKSLTEDEALLRYLHSFCKTKTSYSLVSSEFNCDSNSWEDYSEVDSFIEEESIENIGAEEMRVESMCSEELFS